MTSFSTTTLGDVIDFVFAVCHCAPNLANELRTSTQRFPAKFKSQTDFFLFRIRVLSTWLECWTSNFRENRECIAYAHRKGFINDRQFFLLYDANTSKNPDFPYWKSMIDSFRRAGKWPVQSWNPILQKWHFQACWICSVTRWDCSLQRPSIWIDSCFMYLSQALYVSLPLRAGHSCSLC